MRSLTRGFASLLAVVPLFTIGGNVQPVTAADTFASPVNYLRLFAETNGGGDAEQLYSRDEAVALARRFDVIVGLRWTFADHIEAMHAANPRLRVLAYMNGAMSRPVDRANMPESWFLHDASGSRINNLYFDLQYMDVGNDDWRDFTTSRCAEWIRLSGFDGCFLDDMGAGNIGTNLSGWPIDPRTGQPMTEADWITQASAELAVVQSGNPNKVVTSNGLNNGANYFGPNGSARLLDTSIASAAEGWLRGSRDGATEFRSVVGWKQDVDMLLDAGSRGRSTLLGTKLWTTSTAAQQSQWRAYTYASFLLGTDGYQFLNFNVGGAGRPDASSNLESLNLGSPTETYALRDGVYQRRYSGGLAAVNPGLSPVTVNLGRSYLTPSGEVVSTVTMAAHTGLILISDAAATTTAAVAPTTVASTTVVPTTVVPTTVVPTTVVPTTVVPTTVAPTTVAPTTVVPTTVAPTTVAPTTVAPTTVAPTRVLDTIPPEGIALWPTQNSVVTTSRPTFSGTASDNQAVDRVTLTIRNLSTLQYMTSSGGWQSAFTQMSAVLSRPGSPITQWSLVSPGSLPIGSYRYEVRAFDSSKNQDPTRPSVRITVELRR